MEHISRLNELTDFFVLKTNPPTFVVTLAGEVISGGWTNIHISPRIYIDPPTDGIWEFDVFGDPPRGPAARYIAPVDASLTWQQPDKDFRGMRFIAEENDLELVIYPEAIREADEDAEFDLIVDFSETESNSNFPEDQAEHIDHIVTVSSDTSDELESAHAEEKKCIDTRIVKISEWPETKTKMETRCILKIGGKCVTKTKVPIIYRRTSKLMVYMRVCWASEDDVENALKDCIRQAIAAGVLAGVLLPGGFAAGAAAAKSYLIACLKAKGIELLEDLDVKIYKRKIPGKWKKL